MFPKSESQILLDRSHDLKRCLSYWLIDFVKSQINNIQGLKLLFFVWPQGAHFSQ